MKKFINKLIERLEEEKEAYSDTTYYAYGVGSAIKIVNQLAEEYKPCYKPCTDCEEYDLVRNHCPKLCKVIKETVKEMEEKHSGWIPCELRLPEEELEKVKEERGKDAVFPVLATINKVHTVSGEKYTIVDRAFYGCYNDKNFYNACCDKLDVIAWKPLDAPYQPKGE